MSVLRRAHGIAVLGAAIALWLVTSLVSPFPTSPYTLEQRIRDQGSVDASGVRLAVFGAVPHSYDAGRDETLMYVAWCSHSLCGPLVRVAGDLRGGELRGPLLLVPRGETLAFEPSGPSTEANATPAYARSESPPAIGTAFDIASPLPPFFARLLAGGLATVGLALLVRPRWSAAVPALLGPALASMVMVDESYVIPLQILGMIGVPVGLVVAGLEALVKRRVPHVGLAIVLVGASAFALGLVALRHLPGDGGG